MHYPKVISRKWLRDHGACREQAQLFERVWPDGVAVTRETLEQSATAGLRLEWFAERVLPRSDYAAYRALLRAQEVVYIAELDALNAAYQEQLAPSMYADYFAQLDSLYAAYKAQRGALLINALCQSCHLAYDLQDHIAHARQTRLSRKAAGSLFEVLA